MRTGRLTPLTRSTATRSLFVLALALAFSLVSAQEGRVQDASPTSQPNTGAWSTVGGSSARTGEASGPGPLQNPAVIWHFVPAFAEWDQLAASTVVSDGTFLVGGGFGQPMYALDQATGEVRWNVNVGWSSSANDSTSFFTASADRGTLYVAGTEGVAQCDCNPPAALYALDIQTGIERWRHPIPDLTNLTVPAISGDHVILTAQWDEDFVMAFDAATGEERWRVPLGPDIGNGPSVAVADGTVYVASIRFGRGGVLLALDAESGAELWRAEIPGYPRLAPVIAGNRIFLATDSDEMASSSLTAFDRNGGSEIWSSVLSANGASTVHVTAANGFIYAGFSDFGDDGMPAARLVAYDAASGLEQWRKDGLTSSVAASGVLYASSVDFTGELRGSIFALDGATGAELWHLDGPYGVSAVAGGMLFAVGLQEVWTIAEWTGSGPPETLEVSGPVIEPTVPPGGKGAGPPEVMFPTVSLVRPDGTDLVALGEGTDPQWSPDGTMLAYEANVGDETDVWVVAADGTNAHPVVEVPGLDTHPTWSPDGTRLAFVNGNGGILYVVNADGTGLLELANVSGGSAPQGDPFFQRPSWSPDGTKIAFADADGGSVGISVINVDGSGLTRLTAPEVVAAPIGNETFETVVVGVMCSNPAMMQTPPSELVPSGDVATYEAGGCRRANPGELTFSIVGSGQANTDPWPLASAETDANGEARLRGNLLEGEAGFYTIRMVGPMQGGTMVGSHDIELPFASSYLFVYLIPPSIGMEPVDEAPPPPDDGMGEIPEPPLIPTMTDDELFGPSGEVISTAPVWSPDGTRIAYSVLEPGDDGGISSGGIWLMNPDGSGKVQITDIVPDETAATWSPDGTQLLFASGWTATQVPDIYIARADGSGVIQVTNTSDTPDANPAWSPNGLRIVFSAYSEAGWDLFAVNTDGTGVTPVVSDDSETFAPDWSPDGSRIAFTSQPAYQGSGD